MVKNLLAVGSVFVVALLLVGLTFSSTVEERADYVLINNTEPKTLDPGLATGQPEGRILEAIFEGLTYRDPETLEPTRGAAIKWDVLDEGRKYVFHMREGAKWTNGDPVTAHDFVYAWKRFLAPETAAEYAYLLHIVRHGEAFNTFKGQVEALRKDDGIIAKWKARVDAAKASGDRPEKGLMEAKAWQAFLDENKVRDNVIRAKDEGLRGLLARVDGALTEADCATALAGLEAEAARRDQEHKDAVEHLGVDEGIWASEDGTKLHIELKAFTPYFLHLTCFYPLFPVHPPTVEANPENWFMPDTIVTNGPFKMDRWVVNQKIRLRRNADHWDADKVELETVDVLAIENRTTSLNLYLTGEADWLPSAYPPELIDVLKDRDDFYGNQGFIVYYYRINTTVKGLSDKRVRQALAISFSRDVICNEILRKGDRPTSVFVPPGVPGYEPPDSLIDLDNDKNNLEANVAIANKLLDEAGFPKGANGLRTGFDKIDILHNTDEGHKKVAEYIAQQWEKNLGIEAVAINKEWQAYIESQRKLDYRVSRAGWIGDYLDPNTFLDMWLTKGGNNQTGWGNPFYDQLIEMAGDVRIFLRDKETVLPKLREPDRMKGFLEAYDAAGGDSGRKLDAISKIRFHLFREAEAILVQEEFPVIPIYSYQVSGLIRGDVQGFYFDKVKRLDGSYGPNLKDIHPFRYVSTARSRARKGK
ncbi:MAG: peptide ABC transporter substrate-binding protein [Planctomycetota bacterium]|nr:peptide ABC transporter substrate-binding protein [Planctomycetota bacterium]